MSETITWNSAHGFDCSACGHSQHPCEHWKIFVATASKGQRCCEQGNFGEPHDCAKGQPAESTASTFEEEALKVFDEARNEAALFGDFRNRLVAWFSSKLQKQAASEYERGRLDGRLTVEQVKACLPCSSSTQSDNEWWNVVTANLNHALAATSGTPAPADESGWLIELDRGDGPEWLYYDGLGTEGWTKDSIAATRFSRRQDADGVAAIFDELPVRITEHSWPDVSKPAPPPSSAQATPPPADETAAGRIMDKTTHKITQQDWHYSG